MPVVVRLINTSLNEFFSNTSDSKWEAADQMVPTRRLISIVIHVYI